MPDSDVTIIPSYERVSNSVSVDDNKNTKEFIIEVNDSKAVVYEDTVKFTITPEEGYEVDDIEIKDKDGNIIEYRKTGKENEYEFIMPDTDVLIIPVYKNKELSNNITNPKTGIMILSYSILLLFGLLCIWFIKKNKIIRD